MDVDIDVDAEVEAEFDLVLAPDLVAVLLLPLGLAEQIIYQSRSEIRVEKGLHTSFCVFSSSRHCGGRTSKLLNSLRNVYQKLEKRVLMTAHQC